MEWGCYTRPRVAFRHLAIDGPIGSGKTRLAERLAAKLEGTAVLERAENPFLADFYNDRPGAALQAHFTKTTRIILDTGKSVPLS